MKTDLYTKLVLTIIAVMLTVIACKEFTKPSVIAYADSSSGMQFAAGNYAFYHLYDPRTGVVTSYETDGSVRGTARIGK